MSKFVHIMRGPSGSGKGTFVRDNLLPAKVVSADHYFLVPCGMDVSDNAVHNEDGQLCEYRFDPMKIGLAHNDCFNRFLKALAEGEETIVVDNTNIHLWEFQNYIVAAEMMGYEVRVTAFKPQTIADIKLCAGRNSHNVPIEVVAKMCYEFENHPYDHDLPIPRKS